MTMVYIHCGHAYRCHLFPSLYMTLLVISTMHICIYLTLYIDGEHWSYVNSYHYININIEIDNVVDSLQVIVSCELSFWDLDLLIQL